MGIPCPCSSMVCSSCGLYLTMWSGYAVPLVSRPPDTRIRQGCQAQGRLRGCTVVTTVIQFTAGCEEHVPSRPGRIAARPARTGAWFSAADVGGAVLALRRHATPTRLSPPCWCWHFCGLGRSRWLLVGVAVYLPVGGPVAGCTASQRSGISHSPNNYTIYNGLTHDCLHERGICALEDPNVALEDPSASAGSKFKLRWMIRRQDPTSGCAGGSVGRIQMHCTLEDPF
jgi:hypothetical protein